MRDEPLDIVAAALAAGIVDGRRLRRRIDGGRRRVVGHTSIPIRGIVVPWVADPIDLRGRSSRGAANYRENQDDRANRGQKQFHMRSFNKGWLIFRNFLSCGFNLLPNF